VWEEIPEVEMRDVATKIVITPPSPPPFAASCDIETTASPAPSLRRPDVVSSTLHPAYTKAPFPFVNQFQEQRDPALIQPSAAVDFSPSSSPFGLASFLPSTPHASSTSTLNPEIALSTPTNAFLSSSAANPPSSFTPSPSGLPSAPPSPLSSSSSSNLVAEPGWDEGPYVPTVSSQNITKPKVTVVDGPLFEEIVRDWQKGEVSGSRGTPGTKQNPLAAVVRASGTNALRELLEELPRRATVMATQTQMAGYGVRDGEELFVMIFLSVQSMM
jgi:hypothetical protein